MNLEELATPTRQVERQTILTMEVPAYRKAEDGESGWTLNRERSLIMDKKRIIGQEQKVCDKRFALGTLAEMIKSFKDTVDGQAEAIRQYAKDHDLDEMLDFCPWETYSVDPILESDPISSAVKWMNSDHSC